MNRALLILACLPATLSAQAPVVVQGSALARLRAGIPDPARVQRITATRDTTISLPTGQLVLHPGEILAYRAPATTAHPGAPVPHLVTPLRVVAVDTKGTVRIAALSYAAEGGGLRYDPAADLFRGALDVWLEDASAPGAGYALPQPVDIDVFSDADSVSAGAVNFTGTEAPQRLALVVRAPGDSVRVQFWPRARIDSVTALVRVLPSLRVRVTPTRIAGWGLETAVATVELLGDAHGEFGVTVTPTRAAPLTLQFTHREARSAAIRSRGMGPDTIRVTGAGMTGATAVVDYGFPFALLVAAAVGSAIGTILLQLNTKKRSPALWAFARGLLLGIVAAVAYAVGVKAIPVPLPPQFGEGGAFVVAALAAFLGLRRR